MDEPFFRKAMKAVGIPIFTVDENTVFPKEKTMEKKPDIRILRKDHYQARQRYLCAWAPDDKPHYIEEKRRYIRIIWENEQGEFQHDHICLDCWVKP